MEQKQKLEESVRKRVAAEERSFKVVLRLIEESAVSQEYLADAGQMISIDGYSDVTEERAITKLCGYPICGKALESTPKQKYHISTRSNKVYEISERKNFCSSHCYQASKHFAQQISTSPVWARESEPKVQFTFLTQEKVSGLVGEEVFWSPKEALANEIERLKALDELTEKKNQQQLDDTDRKHEEDTKVEAHKGRSENGESDKCLTTASIVEDLASMMLNTEQKQNDSQQISERFVSFAEEVKEPHSVEKSRVCFKDVCSNEQGSETQVDAEAFSDKHTGEKSESHSSPDCDNVSKDVDKSSIKRTDGTIEEHSRMEENNIETDLLSKPLPGESDSEFVLRLLNKRKHLLSKMADIQQVVHVNKQNPQNKTTESLENISSKISSEDNVHTNKPTVKKDHGKSASKSKVKKSKPKQLSPLKYVGQLVEEWMTKETVQYLDKQRVAKTELKSSDPEVQQHYLKLVKRAEATEKLMDSDDDEDEVSSPSKPVPDFKKLREETEQFEMRVTAFFKGSLVVKPPAEKEESPESVREVYLPTVDSIDQLQIRRKIVLDRLSRVVPDLLTPLKLTLQDVSKELREIVYTFRLDNKNILFKPAEWTLVALILFRLLSVKLKLVDEAFRQPSFVNFCGIMLEGIGHTKEDIDSLVDELVAREYKSLETLHTMPS